MQSDQQAIVDVAAAPGQPNRFWVDALLIGVGLFLAFHGFLIAGVAIGLFAVVFPVLRWRSRGRGTADLYPSIPPELADAHRAVLGATRLAGVQNGDESVEIADEMVIEVAAVLAGRPVRGAAQQRFVAARIAVLQDMISEMRERHNAWEAATAELATIAAPIAFAESEQRRGGWLVGAFVVVMFPFFMAWDVIAFGARLVVRLLEGVVLRVRATARLLLRTAHGLRSSVVRVWRVWRVTRAALVTSLADARHRIFAMRNRFRLRLRRARTSVPLRASARKWL